MARVAYLCSDLLFVSKIRETALALGRAVVGARDVASLVTAAGTRGDDEVVAVVLDLRRPDALAALEALRDAHPEIATIGFCDHEATERMEAARARGCARVLAKGRFSSDLRHLLAPAPASSPHPASG